ncbi:MAG: glutathione ABC transporter substrate-binding protein [Chloroflexota bacterium]
MSTDVGIGGVRAPATRRSFLRAAVVLAGAGITACLLEACQTAAPAPPAGSSASGNSTASPAAASGAATTPAKTGGTLTYAQSQPIKTPDSINPQTYPAAYEADFILYNNLVTFDPDLKIVPDLAQQWDTSADGLTWTFHLRPGVTFHDGTPFNAQAVAAHVKRIQDPQVASPNANLWTHIKSVNVVDDTTVQLVTGMPFGPMLTYLAHGSGGIESPTAVQKFGDAYAQNPTGTGPYKLDSFSPGTELVLARNETYFKGKPPLDKVRFQLAAETASRVAALQAASADVVNDVLPEDAQALDKGKGTKVLRRPGLRTFWMEFNLNLPIFQDKQVRQALNYAVDKNAIVKDLFLGYATALDSPAASTIQGHVSAGAYTYDPAKANQMLDAAGWMKGSDGVRAKDGQPLKFTINTAEGEYPKDIQYVEAVQANLKAVGCDVDIWKVDAASRWSYLRLPIAEAKGEMISFGFNPSNGDLGYHLNSVFHSNSDKAKAPAVWNLMWYANPDVDKVLDQAQTTTDVAKRFDLLGQAQKQIWDDAPCIWLHAPDLLTGIRDNVQGVFLWPTVFTVVRDGSKS